MSQRLTIAVAIAIFSVGPPARGEDVALAEGGVPLKAVVRRNTAVYETADPGSRTLPTRVFDFYYILNPGPPVPAGARPEAAALKDGFYRIATSQNARDAVGWVQQDDVVLWPHRQAIGLRPLAGRKPVQFYRTQRDLIAAYRRVGQDVEPFMREPVSGVGLFVMPILEEFQFDANGDRVTGYRVAAISGRSVQPPGAKSVTVERAKSTFDVVFVVDTTQSMEPFIKATQVAVDRLAGGLVKSLKGSVPVRFGLVGYRDTVADPTPGWYIAQLFCDLESGADPELFRKTLAGLEVAERGSEDTPEDVIAGMRLAVRAAKWNPNAVKCIVLIGDASGHVASDDPKNTQRLTMEGLLAELQPPHAGSEAVGQQIVCHAIQIFGEDEGDFARCQHQFQRLADGRDFPGAFHQFRARQEPQFVDKLVDVITRMGSSTKAVLGSGKAAAVPTDTPGLGLLLELVRAGPSPAGDETPSFASAYAADIDIDGHRQLEPYVLVTRGRLEAYHSVLSLTLAAINNAGDPGARDVSKIVRTLQLTSTMLNLGEDVRADTPLSQVLGAILGLPVRNRVLSYSPAKLAAMTANEFDSFRREVEASKQIVGSQLDNAKVWFRLGRNTRREDEHTYLKLSDLP